MIEERSERQYMRVTWAIRHQEFLQVRKGKDEKGQKLGKGGAEKAEPIARSQSVKVDCHAAGILGGNCVGNRHRGIRGFHAHDWLPDDTGRVNRNCARRKPSRRDHSALDHQPSHHSTHLRFHILDRHFRLVWPGSDGGLRSPNFCSKRAHKAEPFRYTPTTEGSIDTGKRDIYAHADRWRDRGCNYRDHCVSGDIASH